MGPSRYVVAGGHSGELRVLRPSDGVGSEGTCVVASARAPAPIVCVAVLREVVVGGSADGTLRFWRATTGRCGNDSSAPP